MLTTAPPPAATTPRPTPVHANASANTAAGGPAGFASLLSQAERGPVRDDVKPAAQAAQTATTRSARPAAATPASAGRKAPTAATQQPEDVSQEGPPGVAQEGEEAAPDTPAADASALLASLATWTPPALPRPLAAASGASTATQHGPAHGGGAAVLLAGKTGRNSEADGGAEISSTSNSTSTSTPNAGTRAQSFAGLVALAQAAAHDTDASGTGGHQTSQTDGPTPLADVGGAGAVSLPSALIASAASSNASTAAAAEARLSAHPGSAEFASQLGAQLTTFVRAGVQHARLELHPTELGPVTVQIQLDGGAAQVNLAALHADTRQALEQALPQLASSLREAGLTLSGGGVFEQPRQAQPENADSGEGDRPRGGAGLSIPARDNTDALAGPGSASQRRRGVVDLVA